MSRVDLPREERRGRQPRCRWPVSLPGPRPRAPRRVRGGDAGTSAGIDIALLAPAPQRVRVDPDPRADPQHRLVHRQPWLLLSSLNDEPLRALPQLVRVLPRCWHEPTFPRVQTLHQSRGASVCPWDRGEGEDVGLGVVHQRGGLGGNARRGCRRLRPNGRDLSWGAEAKIDRNPAATNSV